MEQIFYNGKIITMKEVSTKEALSKAPDAVLVRDGIIAQIGKFDKIMEVASE